MFNGPDNNVTSTTLTYPNSTSRSPAIIVMHPAGGVKEQTASIYAQKLANDGFITVAYDASHQGASGGLPRFLEDPAARISDVSSVIDYLQQQDFVDPDHIAVVGICAGAGYGVAAATRDHRIKAIATVSGVSNGDVTRLGWNGNEDPAALLATFENITGQPQYLGYVPDPPTSSTPNDLVEAYEYYRTPRGYYPTSENKMLSSSLPLVATFDAFAFADVYLSQPALLVAGSEAGSLWHTERLERLLGSNARKMIIPGATHMALYDILEYVDPAVEEISRFFKESLV